MFAGLVALTIIGVVFFLLIGVVERMVLPRHVIEGASGAREAA
jgi:ABC-type nitrate/sulfonate/bicarbonate transport system permease component